VQVDPQTWASHTNQSLADNAVSSWYSTKTTFGWS